MASPSGDVGDVDPSARFTWFMSRHRSRVRRAVTGDVNDVDVEDVCQDVFTIVWQRFDVVRALGEAAAEGWLLQVARLQCSHQRRTYGRRTRAGARLTDLEGHGLVDEVADPGELVVHAAIDMADVRAVLVQLDAGSRDTLWLKIWSDGTQADLARELGIEPGAFRLRLMRARREFRARYEAQFGPIEDLLKRLHGRDASWLIPNTRKVRDADGLRREQKGG